MSTPQDPGRPEDRPPEQSGYPDAPPPPEPGTDPAPQTADAAAVDRIVARWFRRWLWL